MRAGIPTLRPWQESEAPRIVSFINTPALNRNLLHTIPTPYKLEDALGFIQCSHKMGDQGMERAVIVEGEAVGTIGARYTGNSALIGYWLGEAYWRRGIMSRALPLFIAELPAHITQMTAFTFEFNVASQALLRRCGFAEQPGDNEWARSYDGQWYMALCFTRKRRLS